MSEDEQDTKEEEQQEAKEEQQAKPSKEDIAKAKRKESNRRHYDKVRQKLKDVEKETPEAISRGHEDLRITSS